MSAADLNSTEESVKNLNKSIKGLGDVYSFIFFFLFYLISWFLFFQINSTNKGKNDKIVNNSYY